MIEARGLGTAAGDFVLRDVSFTLPGGAWGIVLGPAGAGKTTLLETIAGVRRAASGRVLLRGADVTDEPPERRGLGIVYQHGYLFPHLSVEENVSYGTAESSHARDLLDLFGASDLRGRAVAALSGGERQVVALARALAPRPDILLLDEPFAALDPRRRTRVRRALHALQRERGLTVLQVTHDFGEARTLGDLALLVEGGRLVQAAPPEQLFRRPATPAAAEFLGAENVYAGAVHDVEVGLDGRRMSRFRAQGIDLIAEGGHPGGSAHAVIRAHDVMLAEHEQEIGPARNVIRGIVVEVVPEGMIARVTLDSNGSHLEAFVPLSMARESAIVPGTTLVATIHATAVHLC